MRGPSIATLVVFVVLVVVLILLPGGCKQQIQANFLQFVSPILKTGYSVQQGLGGVSVGFEKPRRIGKRKSSAATRKRAASNDEQSPQDARNRGQSPQ